MKKNDLSNHVIAFIENLKLVGDFHGKPFELREWQKKFLQRLYEVDKNGNQKINKCLLMLPRKNSKSTLIAAICLYTLLTKRSQQILLAASSESQGKRVLEIIQEMIAQDDMLKGLTENSKTRIWCEETFSFIQVVTSGADVNHGYNPSLVVMDELHAWTEPKHRKLYAALTTGSGTRSNPLTIQITTQTNDVNSLTGEQFDYARNLKNRMVNGRNVRSGEFENPSYFSCLYFASEKDDWTARSTWKAVNPALGDFLREDYLASEFTLARQLPSRESAFKQFYLNCPVGNIEGWIPIDKWTELIDEPENLEQYPCYVGIDTAPLHDLNALVLVFKIDENTFHIKTYFWLSENEIMELSKDDNVPYDRWRDQGFLRDTVGKEAIRFNDLAEEMVSVLEPYRVVQIAADRTHGYDVAYRLQDAGYEIQWYRPGFESMSRPTTKLEALIAEKSITHESNPVMDFCLKNVTLERDAGGNCRPNNRKRRKQDKIDGAIALLYGLGIGISLEPTQFESVYESEESIWL